MRDHDKIMMFAVVPAMLVFVFLFAVAFRVMSARFEAAAYERVTGKHVTTWDAIWLDLRVQEEVK